MTIIQKPSPNFDSRDGQLVDMLVLHYTGMKTMREALDRLCDPAAKVSAHYLVDEDGTVYRLVPEDMRAWHAGVSAWRGNSNINQRSIGIEIVNPGHEFGYREFPAAQMKAVAALCKEILARHTIPARNVVAHSDIAPERKEDPGELFDWVGLAGQGIGLWPSELRVASCELQESEEFSANYLQLATSNLFSYGYSTIDLAKTILAFQRHFFPECLTGVWDRECAIRLASLLAQTQQG